MGHKMKDEYTPNINEETRLRSELNELLHSDLFEEAYKRYIDELTDIAYMTSGVRADIKLYNKKQKEAIRHLIMNVYTCLNIYECENNKN